MGTSYFPHDCTAHTDLKIQMLLDELGFEGLGRYYTVLEIMYPLNGGILDLEDERVVKVLERTLRCDGKTLRAFFDTCVSIGLFVPDIYQTFNHVASERVARTQDEIDKKVRAGKAGGRPKKAPAETT